jgi:hypothetical protein
MNHMLFVAMPRCERPTRSGRLKWKFRSELAALMVAYGFTRGRGRVLNVYDCPWCDGWHLTSKEQQ